MRITRKTIAGVFAFVLGAAAPALMATPAAADSYRHDRSAYDHRGGDHRFGQDHRFDHRFGGFDRHEHRGYWAWRNQHRVWIDLSWHGR